MEQPLVVVFDDIQWGEETFLDLIEHVALLSSGASILLLCIARPEMRRTPAVVAGDVAAEPIARRGRRAADRGAHPGRAAREDRSRRGREPALHRGDGGDGRRGGRRGGCPAHAAGAARGPPGSARRRPSAACSSAGRSRARSSTAAPCRRSHPTETQVTPHLAALVRKPADQARPAPARRRGRLPLPSSVDPRRRLRGAAEDDPRRAPRALRGLAGASRSRARGARRDPRLPPRTGVPISRRARNGS